MVGGGEGGREGDNREGQVAANNREGGGERGGE